MHGRFYIVRYIAVTGRTSASGRTTALRLSAAEEEKNEPVLQRGAATEHRREDDCARQSSCSISRASSASCGVSLLRTTTRLPTTVIIVTGVSREI